MLDELDNLQADELSPEGGEAAPVGEAGGSPGVAHQGDPRALYRLPPNHRIWSSVTPIAPVANGAPGGGSLNGSQPTLCLQTETYAEAVDWHIEIQGFIPTGEGEGSPGVLYIIVQYSIGEQQFTKSYLCTSTVPRVVHVCSRYVSVSAAWIGVTQSSLPGANNVTVACNVGGVNDPPLAERLQRWVRGQGNSSSEVVAIEPPLYGPLQGGKLTAALISIVGMTGDAVCYVQFFDAAAVGSTGFALPILVSPPFTAAYQWAAFDDEADPQIDFSTGLCWALSSTANTYNASSGSGVAQVDVKIAQ